ncbi:MAG: SDR family NAD(P)-dependent oxidoreductase [Myxococcaceae bacterium]|nr:SDR family NAD(P)-dependent oxidoreductase [Myxococcaceae bacterium]MCI0671165.1 SDR family NAD(P)-dependent oxidoreductase [Myxococcaceae bacterium]
MSTSALQLRSRWTLLTGASSGLGLEIARVLAREHGTHLVLVARRADRLEALCTELRAAHGVEAVPVVADLAQPGAAERVFAQATDGRSLSAAILNAGVTYYGNALDLETGRFEQLLHTNVTSVVGLSTRVARHMVNGGVKGAVMLVSSLAGLMPMPFQAAYAGTKAFVTQFGQSLGAELRPRGVSVTVFTPGGIATEMLELAGLDRKFKAGQLGVMSAERCAREAVGALVQRRGVYVPGVVNQAIALSARLLPRGFLASRAASLYKLEG